MIFKFKELSVVVLLCLLGVSAGCSESDVTDQVANVVQAEDEHVLSVKGGTNSSYPGKTIGEAFDNFFGSPTWKYFKGTKESTDEDGDGKPDSETENVDVVEFTGYCMYQDVEVKALIQFTLGDDDSFEATYLSYNEVPQNMLELASLMNTVFGDDDSDTKSESEEPTTEAPTETQTESQLDEKDDSYIIPDSDTVRITHADLQAYLLSLKETNYAKNEIYARHGRKFKSKELQDYFNSKSWYKGTIEPEDFNETEVLSEIERDNIKLLNEVEFSMDPNGYQLDGGMTTKDNSSADFDEQWYRTYNYFVMIDGDNTIEFVTFDFDDFVNIAINGITVDEFVPADYNYDEQWKAYIYTSSNGMTFGYRPDENGIIIINGDYIGEYENMPN